MIPSCQRDSKSRRLVLLSVSVTYLRTYILDLLPTQSLSLSVSLYYFFSLFNANSGSWLHMATRPQRNLAIFAVCFNKNPGMAKTANCVANVCKDPIPTVCTRNSSNACTCENVSMTPLEKGHTHTPHTHTLYLVP